MHMQVYLDRP